MSRPDNKTSNMWGWLQPFQRITTSGAFVPQIDGLRFLAIILVITFHVRGSYLAHQGVVGLPEVQQNTLLNITNTWNWGVQLFFVISGYVLGLPFFQNSLASRDWNVKGYYLRRLTRIEPPLLINLSLMFVVLVLFRHTDAWDLRPHWFASLFYCHGLIYSEPSAVNYVTWSLEIEAQFYLAAPFLACIYLITKDAVRWLAWIGVILIFACASIHFDYPGSRIYYSLLCHGHYFVAGMFCADLSVRFSEKIPDFSPDVVGLLSFASFQLCWMQYPPASHVLGPFLLIIAVLSTLNGKYLKRLASWPLFSTLGGMCYTLYLYHPLLKSTLGRVTFGWRPTESHAANTFAQVIVQSLFIAITGSVLFLLFEKPFMQKDWHTRLRILWKKRARGSQV